MKNKTDRHQEDKKNITQFKFCKHCRRSTRHTNNKCDVCGF